LNCSLWRNPSKEELNTGQAKAIIWQASRLGTMHISYSGGETMLRTDMPELVKFTRRLGVKCSINSNGTLIDDEVALDLGRAGLNAVYISLDGSTEQINDGIRVVKGSYSKALQAIESLKRIRRRHGMRVFVNSTINNRNLGDLENLAEFCRSLDLDGWTMSVVQDVESYGPSRDVLLNASEAEDFNRRLIEIRKSYPGLIPYDREYIKTMGEYIKSPQTLYRYRCVAGYSIASIMPNGDLHPCPAAFHKIGNLMEDSLRNLWFSEEARLVRERVRCNRHPICWFDCIAPLNIMVDEARRGAWHLLVSGHAARHLWKKVTG
ncbi:MAG: radical SAM protein, partial [bacterium]|nr:radical SAM protein [bacterium]